MLAKLRVTIAALLIPLVWLHGSPPANAAATNPHIDRAWAGVRWDVGALPLYGDFAAGASMALDANGKAYITNMWCYGQQDKSPGWSQHCEAGGASWNVWFLGGGCPEDQQFAGQWEESPHNGITHVAGIQYTAGEGMINVGTDCDPAQVCLSSQTEKGAPFEEYSIECVPIALEPAGVIPPCSGQEVSMNRPLVGAPYPGQNGSGSNKYWLQQITWRGVNGTGAQDWMFYAVTRPTNGFNFQGGTASTLVSGSPDGPVGSLGQSATWTTEFTLTFQVSTGGSVRPAAPTSTIIGAGAFSRSGTGLGSTASGQAHLHYPTEVAWNGGGGMLGVSNKSKCAFYFGTPLLTGDADDGDLDDGTNSDPTVGPPVDPLPPDSITDPPWQDNGDDQYPTDEDPESDWWKWLIKALASMAKMLVDAIGKVVDAILGLLQGLLELLMMLFVPDPSSWNTEGLVDQLNESGPSGTVVEVADGFGGTVSTYQAAGDGCGVLFEMPIGDDTAVGDTCTTSTTLGALRAVVSAGLITLTGIGIVRMLGGVLER